jgi:hypothetical protein
MFLSGMALTMASARRSNLSKSLTEIFEGKAIGYEYSTPEARVKCLITETRYRKKARDVTWMVCWLGLGVGLFVAGIAFILTIEGPGGIHAATPLGLAPGPSVTPAPAPFP